MILKNELSSFFQNLNIKMLLNHGLLHIRLNILFDYHWLKKYKNFDKFLIKNIPIGTYFSWIYFIPNRK